MRTFLPKSNREAAHSPPRHEIQIPIPTSPTPKDDTNMSSSLPLSPLATSPSLDSPLTKSCSPPKTNSETTLDKFGNDEKTSIPSEKQNQRSIKSRPFGSKTFYRSRGAGMTTGRLSERAYSGDFSCNATLRKYFLFFCFVQAVRITTFL